MSILARAVLGLAAVVAIAIGGINLLGGHPSAGAPSPSPIATPVATPRQLGSPLPEPSLDATFTSTAYNYSVRYPGTWHATAAPRAWSGTINTGADKPSWGDPSIDALAGTDVRLVVWAQTVPQAAAQTQAQAGAAWAQKLGIGEGTCEADSQLPATFVLGTGAAYNLAYTVVNGCPSNGGLLKDGVVYEVAVVPEGHGWLYGWDFTFDGRVDAAYVRAVLESVTFVGPRSF